MGKRENIYFHIIIHVMISLQNAEFIFKIKGTKKY